MENLIIFIVLAIIAHMFYTEVRNFFKKEGAWDKELDNKEDWDAMYLKMKRDETA